VIGALNEVPQVQPLPHILDFDKWGRLLLARASYPKEYQNFSPEFHQYM
jgi:hypothetical protein